MPRNLDTDWNSDPSTYIPPFSPLPPLPPLPVARSDSADERLNAAASMIQRRGASNVDRLRAFDHNPPYPQPQISVPSTPTSFYSPSQLSRTGSFDADHSSLSRPDEDLEKVIKYAGHALLNDMALNSGWRHANSSQTRVHAHTLWADKITECLNQACVHYSYPQFVPSTKVEKRIVRSLSNFRSKMVGTAEAYAKEFLQVGAHTSDQVPDFVAMQERVAQITDPTTPESFFLHKQNPAGGVERLFGHPILEDFHLDCWYSRDTSPVKLFRSNYTTTTAHMLALSSVALLCALHRVSQGRCANQGKPIEFSTKDYGDHFDVYHEGIITGLQHASFGQQLRGRLRWLNDQGMDRMRPTDTALPRKLPRIVIPASVAASVSASSADARAYSPAPFNATVASTSTFDQASASSYGPAGMVTDISASSFDARAYSPAPFDAIVASTSTRGQALSSSHVSAGMSTSGPFFHSHPAAGMPPTFFPDQIPSECSTGRAGAAQGSHGYSNRQYTDSFM